MNIIEKSLKNQWKIIEKSSKIIKNHWKSLKIIENYRPGPLRRPLAPGGQRGETPNDTHYKTRSLKEMRLSCGLRMLLKLQATPMLSFSSELKNNEKQKLAFEGAGPGRAHHKIPFFRLNPGEPVALRARTQLRTDARNRNRNRFPSRHHPRASKRPLGLEQVF